MKSSARHPKIHMVLTNSSKILMLFQTKLVQRGIRSNQSNHWSVQLRWMSKTHGPLSVVVFSSNKVDTLCCQESRLASRKLTKVYIIDFYFIFFPSVVRMMWLTVVHWSPWSWGDSVTKGAWEQFAAVHRYCWHYILVGSEQWLLCSSLRVRQ